MKPLYFRHINGRTWLNDLDISDALRSYRIERDIGYTGTMIESIQLDLFASTEEPPDEIKLAIAERLLNEK